MLQTWIALQSSDLDDARAVPLLNAARQNALNTGQADPTAVRIAAVTEELRGAIGFSGKYQISLTAGTIPPNLKDMAVAKIVRMLLSRLEGGGSVLTESDLQAERVYEARLGLIREGRYPIDLPPDPDSVPQSLPTGLVESIGGQHHRQFTQHSLRNLL
jgi:hypothetical protein